MRPSTKAIGAIGRPARGSTTRTRRTSAVDVKKPEARPLSSKGIRASCNGDIASVDGWHGDLMSGKIGTVAR